MSKLVSPARAPATRRRRTADAGPVSVALPSELQRRIAREAARRELKLSTTVRVLAAERLAEIEEAAALSRIEQFQREQAWSAWDQLQGGQLQEATIADVDAVFSARRERPRRRNR